MKSFYKRGRRSGKVDQLFNEMVKEGMEKNRVDNNKEKGVR